MSRIDFPKIYNPQNQTRQELINNFVVRMGIFQDIFQEIKSSKMEHPEQHYIIQGIRGQGKTTLLLRIAYEIEKDKNLNKYLIPIVFSEEQYKVRKLYKLWEETAEYLKSYSGFETLHSEMQNIEYDDDFEEKCFHLLEKTLQKNKKKLILFIDNIADMLNKFSEKEHHRLREILIESSEIRIIGASAESLEFHHDYSKPFYKFFRMPVLKGLHQNETKTLLKSLGEKYKRERVKDIVQNQPGRVEALRRMTGGVIRTIIILYQIFIDDENGNAFQDLEKILDEVTPLYKQRMDHLSAQQQEIVDIIALNWDAISTKDIAMKAREKSKAVSSQLKFLVRNQIIEQQGTNTKNYLYRLSERFLNIWYLMRHGGKSEENKVKWLIEFLQEWCDEKTLEIRATKQLEAIKKGTIYEKQALYLTEALAWTPIKRDIQDKLIKETRKYLENKKSEFLEYLHPSDIELRQSAIDSYKEKDIQEFIKHVEKIRIKDAEDLKILGHVYGFDLHDITKSEKYLLEAIEQEDTEALNNLALLYQNEFKDFKKAEKYYLLAVDKEDAGAMYNIALLYKTEFKDFKKAEKYYLMAVEKEDAGAMYNLALLYETEFKDFKKAEKYYLMAIEKEHADAMNNLARLYYFELKDVEKAKKYCLMAINEGISGAMFGLALIYQTEFKDFKKAEKYYLMAIEKEHEYAMIGLALLYQTEFKDFKKAEKYYLLAVKKENAGAMYNLALLYDNEFKDFKKAEKYYLMAAKHKHKGVWNSLSWMYFENIMDKEKAITYAKKGYKIEKSTYMAHTYTMILLWNNEIEEALRISKDFMENKEAYEKFPKDIRQFLMLLIAKKQYHSALKIFNVNPFKLKDRFKPVYYALMYFLQKEYPNEYIKMGSELKQTVEEIIAEIGKMAKDYS